MSERIPQSVAKRVLLKAYLDTDHFSAATGKTIAVVISKNGAAFGNPSAGATNATEIANGWYYVDLSTTDTGTTGPLAVRGTNADVDDVEVIFEVVNAFNAGFTGVPGAAADTAGGLPISDAGGFDIDGFGNIVFGYLDVAVSSRASQTTADADHDLTQAAIAGLNDLSAADVAGELATYDGPTKAELDAAVATLATAATLALVKAKTDNLPSDPADESNIQAAIATLQGFVDTEVAAALAAILLVKAKTDLIPAAPAAAGDIPTTAQIADKFLGRNLAGGSDGGRTVQDSLRANRNRVEVAAGSLTVYQEDDATPAWSAALTTDAAADPIVEIDPS